MKRPVTITIVMCMVFSCTQLKNAHKPQVSAIPALHILNDTAATALKISSLSIDVTVAANIATTTFDIRFYNPNPRILEGEFDFPLADGQNITRYALEVSGSLREGVVVEKTKARVAFENTVRKGIDPGLVEKTKGNNFRTRIYPIPANGYKRVLIAVEQNLEQKDKKLFYSLPLYADNQIDSFYIKSTVVKSSVSPAFEENNFQDFEFHQWKNGYVASHDERNFRPNQYVSFYIPFSSENKDLVITENQGDQTYFYVNSRLEPRNTDKTHPSKIGLFWDVSASGEKRDLKKETELLKEYLSQLGNISVSLIPFNIFIQGKKDFQINGDVAELLARIKELKYDGGTQYGAIDLSRYDFDEVLLFSDGLSTFGKQDMIFSPGPVMTINSSPSANYSYLKYISRQTHGNFIDLNSLELKFAITELRQKSLQVLNVVFGKEGAPVVEDLVWQTGLIADKGFSFAGKLKGSRAHIRIEFGFDNDVVETREYTIEKKDSSDYDQVKRMWASLKISDLDLQYEKNKEEITQLGKEFSIVTQNTSLLVLDRVEDYVEYEINPPAELQKEYFVLLEERKKEKKDEKKNAFDEALGKMKELKDWWNKTHLPKPQTIDTVPPVEMVHFTPPRIAPDDDTTRATSVPNANGFAVTTDSLFVLRESQNLNYSTNDISLSQALSSRNWSATDAMGNFKQEESNGSDIEPEIEITEWKPDAPYLKELEKLPVEQWKEDYFLLKKTYSDQPAFYIDVARAFFTKKDKQFAIEVLSNVAEMKLENAELLRMIANQLIEEGEKELAIETLKEVLKIREEEPQSYRDLALAYNEAGEFNKAIDLLYKLIVGNWDGRFGDVKAIALNEMNAIISMHGDADLSLVDRRFIYAMPVDVRIVIGWNCDNSDIDLWVTDPKKEKCFYEHTETQIGGKISHDVTQGYGPEEYSLKKAVDGIYLIEANLYGDTRQTLGGPITIKAELFTDFGRPNQKRKMIHFRVMEKKEVVKVGVLKFAS